MGYLLINIICLQREETTAGTRRIRVTPIPSDALTAAVWSQRTKPSSASNRETWSMPLQKEIYKKTTPTIRPNSRCQRSTWSSHTVSHAPFTLESSVFVVSKTARRDTQLVSDITFVKRTRPAMPLSLSPNFQESEHTRSSSWRQTHLHPFNQCMCEYG